MDIWNLEGKRVRLTGTDDEGRIGYVHRVVHEDEIHVWLDGRFLGPNGTGEFQPEVHICVGYLELETSLDST